MTPEELLTRVPQQEPFRFIDEIEELGSDRIVASYTWRPDADFYRGHFPGNPITPGVLLIESMAQAAIVALGIHLLDLEVGPDEATKYTTLFTDAQVDFSGIVEPGQRTTTMGEVVFFRRRKLRSSVEMTREDGRVVCSGQISGMGVLR